MMDASALLAEFQRDAVSWRCQTVSKNGDKGLALAYIDARDVMRRLDEVCGPTGWQDRYEVHGSKTLCYLSIRCGDEWITKADGAGDTDVEAEKGSLSDAFKRAAVKWGIGRYLYDVPAPWVPCETYEAGGKKRWSKWTADPWSFVRQPAQRAETAPRPAPVAHPGPSREAQAMAREIGQCRSAEDINALSRTAEFEEFWSAASEVDREFARSAKAAALTRLSSREAA